MIVATVPLNVRLAVLALVWWMPAGLAELAGLVATKQETGLFCRNGPKGASHKRVPFPFLPNGSARIVRAVGVCSLVALVALSLEGARLWYESVLLAVGAFVR
jgi:hypothetical protein